MSKPYAVIWKRALIEDAVVRYFLDAKEHGDFVAAISEIDRQLSRNPRVKGESRPPYERI